MAVTFTIRLKTAASLGSTPRSGRLSSAAAFSKGQALKVVSVNWETTAAGFWSCVRDRCFSASSNFSNFVVFKLFLLILSTMIF